jgi:hypothetical protein
VRADGADREYFGSPPDHEHWLVVGMPEKRLALRQFTQRHSSFQIRPL